MLRSLENLSSHRLLDRLIRGRLWIGIIAFALIGIVTLQLGLLKLNSGIGRALERQATLQRENAALSIENSELAAGNRVESQAASRLGMKLVPLGGLRFLRSYPPSDIARAAAALRTPVQHSTEVPSSASAADEASSSQATGVAASGGQSQSAEQADSETATTSTSATQPEGTTTQGEAPAAAQTSTGEAVDPSATTPAQAPSEASGGGTAAPTG